MRPHHIALALGVARPADPAHRWLLPGRVVLVTGGSRGLGLELACEFGRRSSDGAGDDDHRALVPARHRRERRRLDDRLDRRDHAVEIEGEQGAAGVVT